MTTAIKIDRDIPAPKNFGRPGPEALYPFRDLEVGDSFKVDESANHKSVYVLAYRHGKDLGRKFTCRKIDGGLRVWRVA